MIRIVLAFRNDEYVEKIPLYVEISAGWKPSCVSTSVGINWKQLRGNHWSDLTIMLVQEEDKIDYFEKKNHLTNIMY